MIIINMTSIKNYMFSINIPGLITDRIKKKKGSAILPDLFGLFQKRWRIVSSLAG